jgi:PhnB protein
MAGKVKAVPDGYHTATPYLVVDGAARAIEFYKKAFGATEIMRLGSDEHIMHAEMKIGDSPIMLADEYPDMKIVGPHTLGGTPVSIMLYVDDVDAMFNQAVAAGATIERAVENQFYGDRSGGVRDPFGHRWYIATHVEDVSNEEMGKRAAAMHEDKDCAEA